MRVAAALSVYLLALAILSLYSFQSGFIVGQDLANMEKQKAYDMLSQISPLNENEIESVAGAPLPLVAYLTATGIAILAVSVASFNNGYSVGKDIAQNQKKK